VELVTSVEPVSRSRSQMKEKEVLKIIFSKLYEEIDDVTYDCEDILIKLHESGLVNDKRCQNIRNKQESEKNR